MSTARLDQLRDIEKAVQKKWADEDAFSVDAPAEDEEKYMVTFPYPYMNGLLHLGHAFSMTKSEFAVRYWRLKGKRALWPFGLHVTGMPIAACAQRIANEIKQYGNPPVFPAEALEAKKEEKKEVVVGKFQGKKQKQGPAKPQWQIMQSLGIPDTEIPKFADPQHWLQHFPSLALEDLKAMGCHIDYRRSFITTETNPFYDRFVRWQFKQLRAKGLIEFGTRYSIYSPMDGQPCADHDRATGEGVAPVEYTCVKLQVQDVDQQECFKPHLGVIAGRGVYLLGATMRVETVVGQTNCWMSPKVTYSAFEFTNVDGTSQVCICTQRSARNFVYQDIAVNGKKNTDPTHLFQIDGAQMVGIPLSAPMAPYKTIYTLPMETISDAKGTAIVMSVPSDSPDDYTNLQALVKKAEYRAKLGLKDEWVLPFAEPPLIIDCGGELGTYCAKVACEKAKVQGPKDAASLDEAKKIAYTAGFYQGVMVTGPFKDMKVSEAKVEMAKKLVADGSALKYYEPMSPVQSRSGDECVVALCDQWFIKYGEEDWKKAVSEHVSNTLETYFPTIKNGLHETLDWLSSWPCSRSFGLGTYLPFEDAQKVLIDSLSDSTVYMCYYAIAQFLHSSADGSENLDGKKPNKYGITPEMMTDEAFDFIYHGKGTAEATSSASGLPLDVVKQMRREFQFWYPMDMRVSGKDLIQNHLTMCLYNHAAIWPDPQMWPRSIYCNGHIMVNGEKMSKRLGNFVTLKDAVVQYSTDAMRLALADSGDSLDDANFVTETAAGFIMKLTTLLELAKERVGKKGTYRTGEFTLFDRIFENAINNTIVRSDNFFKKMMFRSALNQVFYEFLSEESQWKLACGPDGLHEDLVFRFFNVFTVILSPLAPHIAEYLWTEVLGNAGSAQAQRFPVPTAEVDLKLLVAQKLIQDVAHDIRTQALKLAKKKTVMEEAHVYVAEQYLDWQVRGLEILTEVYQKNECTMPADVMKVVSKNPDPLLAKNKQEVMGFVAFVKMNVEKFGPGALSLTPTINDKEVLTSAMPFLLSQTSMKKIDIRPRDDESTAEHKNVRSKCRPNEPAVAFPPQPKA